MRKHELFDHVIVVEESHLGQVQIPLPWKSKVWQDEYQALCHRKDWCQRLSPSDMFNIAPTASVSDGNTGSLTPGNRLHSWNQCSARTEYCAVHSLDAPVAGQSRRFTVVSLHVEILECYVQIIYLLLLCLANIALDITKWQLRQFSMEYSAATQCCHSYLLPGDIYRSY